MHGRDRDDYIDHLIERDENEAEEGLARYAGYIDHLIDSDERELMRWATGFETQEELNESIRERWMFDEVAMRRLAVSVEMVFRERFDLMRLMDQLDGQETEFQAFMRKKHGLTPIFADGLDDFLDEEVVMVEEPDEDTLVFAAYRKAVWGRDDYEDKLRRTKWGPRS